MITSNRPIEEWGKLFSDVPAAGAILDRLLHHAEIIPILPEFKDRISLFDTDKIPYVIEEGERAAERQVPYLRRLLAGA